MKLDFVIVTVTGREEVFNQTMASMIETAVHTLNWVVIKDRPTAGEGWNEGARLLQEQGADGDYLMLTCDDYDWLPGWDVAASRCVDEGYLPAPLLYNPDGSLRMAGRSRQMLSDGVLQPCGSVPYLTWDWWHLAGSQTLNQHYGSDDWLHWVLRQHGIETVFCEGYALVERQATNGGWRSEMNESERRAMDVHSYRESQRQFLENRT